MPQGKQYRVSGAIFQKDRGPAFSGFIEIDGVKTYISLWEKVSGSGTTYWQISEDKKPPGQNQQAQRGRPVPPSPRRFDSVNPPLSELPQRHHQGGGPVIPQSQRNDMDDDIPFSPEFR